MTTKNRELVAVEPYTFMRRILREFAPWFEGERPFFAAPRAFGEFTWVPELEVFERENHLLVRVDLPGLKKEEVTVTVTGEGLAIEGERKLETEKTEKAWYRTERTYGRFFRLVPLPEGVKAEEVTATFVNGVLEVKIPIPVAAAVAPATRKVEIAAPGEQKEARPAA
jgi:HSP20 family protein